MAAVVADGADELCGTEELRARVEGKGREAAALRLQVQRSRLEAQQLRLQLQAAGVADPSLIPARFRAGSGGFDAQQMELRSLLQWLVDIVDLTLSVTFECGSNAEVMVGGRRVQLPRMATWPLAAGEAAAGLKLSVPLDMQDDIADLLRTARRRGQPGEAAVHRLAGDWEMLGAEVASAAAGQSEPAIFLVHRSSAQAIIIAQWPAVDFQPRDDGAGGSPFSPERHFASVLSEVQAASEAGEDSSEVCQQHASAADSAEACRRPPVSTGDRVEVEYDGQWFTGVLEWVDGNVANVKCDVDSPGVITVAPLTSVRPARAAPQQSSQKRLLRHARARSMG